MKTNKDLKLSNLPHCDWTKFLRWTGEGEMSSQDREALDAYFIHFVDPGSCIKCGHQQGVDRGNVVEVLMGKGRFRFGIQNGEGTCTTGGCGWPARAIHRNVGPIQSLELILQYHPDVVTFDD